jgi:hypothetical protein
MFNHHNFNCLQISTTSFVQLHHLFNYIIFSTTLFAWLWIWIRIGSGFNDFVDLVFESGSRGQKMKEKYILFSVFLQFDNKKVCCVFGSILDPNSMTLWVRIEVNLDHLFNSSLYILNRITETKPHSIS